jgi:ribonuclease D
LEKKKGLYQNNITHEEINDLEVCQFGGTIHLIESREHIAGAVKIIRNHRIIGFDTETRPNFRKGRPNKVALIQFATTDDAFVIRLNKTGLVNELVSVFEDEDLIKIGVAVREDIRRLRAMKNFTAAGFLELQSYSGYFGIESNSLKKLAAIVMGVKISKSQQLSDWEAEILSEAQVRYAATDAWACLRIYETLRNKVFL